MRRYNLKEKQFTKNGCLFTQSMTTDRNGCLFTQSLELKVIRKKIKGQYSYNDQHINSPLLFFSILPLLLEVLSLSSLNPTLEGQVINKYVKDSNQCYIIRQVIRLLNQRFVYNGPKVSQNRPLFTLCDSREDQRIMRQVATTQKMKRDKAEKLQCKNCWSYLS